MLGLETLSAHRERQRQRLTELGLETLSAHRERQRQRLTLVMLSLETLSAHRERQRQRLTLCHARSGDTVSPQREAETETNTLSC